MAKRHSAFQHIPYPDETLSPDIEVRQLANLHARLDDCAASYLKALGRLDRRAAAELTDTVHGIRSLTRPGYSPLNMHLSIRTIFELRIFGSGVAIGLHTCFCRGHLAPSAPPSL